MKIVVFGLSLSSSWGNGHATTYRALLRALARRGHQILFMERDVPWYSGNRDCPNPDFCDLRYYDTLSDLATCSGAVRDADAVVVGSYVPDGIEIGRLVQKTARGVKAFYDIDTPVTLAKIARGEYEYICPELIPGYDIYFSFTGGLTLDKLEGELGSPCARELYCSVDTDVYRPLGLEKRWDLSYLGTYSPDRQPPLEMLLIDVARKRPDLRFCVAGPQYPDDLDWPSNVTRVEHLAPSEHASFYSASRYTLNVTRADMKAAGWSPSVRLFEASACGAAIISDPWPGIESIFQPQEEILLAEDSADVLRALDRDPGPLGAAARRRVLDEHSAEVRAAQLETYLVRAAPHAVAGPLENVDHAN